MPYSPVLVYILWGLCRICRIFASVHPHMKSKNLFEGVIVSESHVTMTVTVRHSWQLCLTQQCRLTRIWNAWTGGTKSIDSSIVLGMFVVDQIWGQRPKDLKPHPEWCGLSMPFFEWINPTGEIAPPHHNNNCKQIYISLTSIRI